MQKEIITNWADLANLIDGHKKEYWLYRGVTRSDHKLIPNIGREGALGRSYKYIPECEPILLDEFKRQARPLVNIQGLTDLEWMAIGQHHGLLTRLLDWTQSVLVAAFFATERGVITEARINSAGKIESVTYFSVIYGIRDLPLASKDDNPFTIEEVKAYNPSHISERIAPQRAMFTIHPKPDTPFEPSGLVSWELKIYGTLDIKLALDACGITRASLFPGIDGLAMALNWQYKWQVAALRGENLPVGNVAEE